MTQTYSQIRKQIDSLQQKADSARRKEAAGVVARIKHAISFYSLTAHELGLGNGSATVESPVRKARSSNASKGSKSKISTAAKFRDEQGNEWVGRGPRPLWLRKALTSGKSLSDFAAGAPAKSAEAKTPGKPKIKRKPAAKFSDGNGKTWSGRGRKPGWYIDALAQGKSSDSMLMQAK